MSDLGHPDQEAAEHRALLEEKKLGTIGGTEASIIALEHAGVKPKFGRTAFGVWSQMMGLTPPGAADNDRMEMGRLMEEPLAVRFQRRTGLSTIKIPMLIHPNHEWVTGHLDRGVLGPDRMTPQGDLEIKTVGYYQDRDLEWSNPEQGEMNKVPLDYLLQAIWYLGIPRDAAPAFERDLYIAAQFDFQAFRIYRWEASPQFRTLWKRMFEACQEFREKHVLTGDPPPAVSLGDQKRWLDWKYPVAGKEILTGDARTVELAKAYKEAARKEKLAKTEKEGLGVELGKLIGAAYGIKAEAQGITASIHRPSLTEAKISYVRKAFRSIHVSVKGEADDDDGVAGG